jgi:hypothetical protein
MTARQRLIAVLLLGANFMLSVDFSILQRVAVTVGIPVLGAVMVMRADLLAGIHLALAADVLLTLAVVVMIWARLKRG